MLKSASHLYTEKPSELGWLSGAAYCHVLRLQIASFIHHALFLGNRHVGLIR